MSNPTNNTHDRLADYVQSLADEMARARGPRVRQRTLSPRVTHILATAARAAVEGYAARGYIGGTVANSYGYPAQTDALGVCALRTETHGRTSRVAVVTAAGRISANKATGAGAVSQMTGGRGPWWMDAQGRTPRVTPAALPGPAEIVLTTRRSAVLPVRYWRDPAGTLYRTDITRSDTAVQWARVAVRLARLSGVQARRDRQGLVVLGRGDEEWHETVQTRDEALRCLPRYRAAMHARRIAARAAALDTLIAERGDQIWVGIEDSVRAGNCRPMTEQFARDYAARVGAEGAIGGATAVAILAVRDDDFARRACRAAALRYQHVAA